MPVEDNLLKRVDRLIAKGVDVLATREYREALRSEFVNYSAAVEWQSQTLSFLTTLVGNAHVYTTRFYERTFPTAAPSSIEAGQGILRAVKEDLQEGVLLTGIRNLVSAEIFSDFLDMAKHLHESGYKDPAASLTGAVLEDGLRRIAQSKNVTVKQTDNLNSLNQRLAASEIYTSVQQKSIAAWTAIRNNADHGHFERYSQHHVSDMIRGVEAFLASYLSA